MLAKKVELRAREVNLLSLLKAKEVKQGRKTKKVGPRALELSLQSQ